VADGTIWSCTRKSPWMSRFAYPLLAFSIRRPPGSCGVSVATIRNWRRGRRRVQDRFSAVRKIACPRLPRNGPCMSKRIHTCSASISTAGTSCCGRRGRVRAGDRVLRRLAGAHGRCRAGHVRGNARVECLPRPAARNARWSKAIRSTACLFPQHGPGRKHQRKIELEEWQDVILRKFPGDFPRGLFHSDGWRGVNRVA